MERRTGEPFYLACSRDILACSVVGLMMSILNLIFDDDLRNDHAGDRMTSVERI